MGDFPLLEIKIHFQFQTSIDMYIILTISCIGLNFDISFSYRSALHLVFLKQKYLFVYFYTWGNINSSVLSSTYVTWIKIFTDSVLVEDLYNNYPNSNEYIEINVSDQFGHYLGINIFFDLYHAHDKRIHQYILMLWLDLLVTVHYCGTEKPTWYFFQYLSGKNLLWLMCCWIIL